MVGTVDHVVTLIHGTFAHGAAWTRRGSKLTTILGEVLPGRVLFEKFDWSGQNSHQARKDAGAALAKKLSRQIGQHPTANHYLIGHSHGGNVALYALSDHLIESRIKRIVCLNTPFIFPLMRNTVSNGYASIILIGLVILSLVLAVTTGITFNVLNGTANSGLFVLAFVVTAIGIGLFWTANVFQKRWIRVMKIRRQQIISDFSLPQISSPSILCLWSASDEVYAIFSLADAVNNIPYLLYHPFLIAVAAAITFVFHYIYPDMIFPLLRAVEFDRQFLDPPLVGDTWIESAAQIIRTASVNSVSTSLYAISYAFVLTTIIYLLNVALKLLPFGAGSGRMRDVIFVQLISTLLPFSARYVEFCDLDIGAGLLNHSAAYQHEATIKLIADWIVSGRLAAAR